MRAKGTVKEVFEGKVTVHSVHSNKPSTKALGTHIIECRHSMIKKREKNAFWRTQVSQNCI